MSKRTELDRLLELLAGSPQGVTSPALHGVHGISLATMEQALKRKVIRGEIEPLKNAHKPVVRLFITPLGLTLLKVSA